MVFGLFHGLVFLPVVLALIGSDSADAAPADKDSDSSSSGADSVGTGTTDDSSGEAQGKRNAAYVHEEDEVRFMAFQHF